jgi:ABC-type sugar transport system permease subunit
MAVEAKTPTRHRTGFLGLGHGREGAKRTFITSTVVPMVLYMLFWNLLPIVWGFALAFFEYSPRRAGGPLLGLGGDNPFVGLQHFGSMLNFAPDAPLEVRQFHIAFKNSVLFAFLVVPLNLLITLPLAAMIESVHERIKPIFRTIFFLPVLAPSVGVAIMWGYIYHPQRGLLNAIIRLFAGRLIATNWLGDPNLNILDTNIALAAIIVAYLWQDLGYNLVIFIAAMQSIPESLKDAALIDGANRWQLFRHITMPLLRPTILLAIVLTMADALRVFDIVQVMTDGRPADMTQVLTLSIYDYAFRYQRMGWAAAVSVVLFVLVFSISYVQTRLLRTEWEY